MTAPQGPWYITDAAVAALLRLAGRPPTGPNLDWAAVELERMAVETMASDRVPQHTNQRIMRYRGPRRPGTGYDRAQLIVSTEVRPEGPLPQLVDVVPEHAGLTRGRK